jgi:predicted small lipoprotein YifL
MRRFCSGIAGVVLAFTLAGCGESPPETPVANKGADIDAINKLRDNMSANAKNKKTWEKPKEDKPADKKPAEKKP